MINVDMLRAKKHLKRNIRRWGHKADVDKCVSKLFQEHTFRIIGDYPNVRKTLGSWANTYKEKYYDHS